MSEFVKRLRDLVFVWGSLSAFVAWAFAYFGLDCIACVDYSIEIMLAILTIASSAIVWVFLNRKIEKGLESIHITLLKSDVDRYYSINKDKETLMEDEIKYLHMLKGKITYYGVNSFTQRKVDKLLKKDLK